MKSANTSMMRSTSLRDMHKAGDEGLNKATCAARCGALTCGSCPLIYALVMCIVYWGWMTISNEYNDKIAVWPGDVSPFDSCGGLIEASTLPNG